jgi:hypothetical protein
MRLWLEHRLLYVEAVVRYRGREIHLPDVVLELARPQLATSSLLSTTSL